MPRWPVTFRILLSLVLVLDGIGGAFGAVRMPVAPASHGDQAMGGGMPDRSSSCHPEGAARPPGQDTVAPGAGMPGKRPAAPDCCAGAACNCACASLAQVMLPATAVPAQHGFNDGVAGRPSLGHPDAASAHLIRPPIG